MLEVNGYKVPEHTSYSSLTTWLSCGWKYYLSRIAQIEEQPSTWAIGGSAVHRATENYDLEDWKRENIDS